MKSTSDPPADASNETAHLASPSAMSLVVIALVGVLFWNNYDWLVHEWRYDPYYSHGLLIPIISGYLIYRKRDRLRALPQKQFIGGIFVIVLSLCLHFAATYVDVNFVSSFALVGVLLGLAWWLYGRPVIKELAFPLAFLVFMIPLGRLLIDRVAQPMQLFAAQVAGAGAQLLGMPTEIDGTTLRIPDYTFEVAVACSGLKSAIAMLALGALLAYVVKGVWWKKVVIFASALPVAMLANAARIWVTMMLGRALSEKAAEGFFHTFSGLLVFLLAFIGLFGVTNLLKCKQLRDDI